MVLISCMYAHALALPGNKPDKDPANSPSKLIGFTTSGDELSAEILLAEIPPANYLIHIQAGEEIITHKMTKY